MSAGRLLARGTVKVGNGQMLREPSRTRLYATLTLAAGAAAGMAAATAIGAPAIASAHYSAEVIPANALFTPVPPVQKTVDIYDPAPPAPRVQSAPAAAPAETEQRAPEPPEHETEHESGGGDH